MRCLLSLLLFSFTFAAVAAPGVRSQAMKILPAGAVRPEGYLRTQLVRQVSGLTGNAEELYADIGQSAWLGVKDGDAWERGPYYLKGLLPLAFALDDPALKVRTKKWIDSILSLQQPDGYFSSRTNNWWANMIALHVLRDWSEATGDKRAETFLSRYFAYQRKALKTTPLEKDSCWAIARGGDNLEIVLWLYDRTHDEGLLELADLLAKQTKDWNRWYRKGDVSTGYATHIVNFMQGLKFPALKWRLTGDEEERTAALAAFDPKGWAFAKHGRPDGMLNGTEPLSGRAASQGTELCAVAERILSDATCAAVTGEAAYGDRLESVAYNTLPGQVTPDLKGVRYYTLMNQPACLAEDLDFHENGKVTLEKFKDMQFAPAICPGPCAGFGCCRSNFHFAWPKFVQSLWMAKDGGLAAVAYGPCHVKYAGFELRVRTDYPFREAVNIEVLSAPSAEAPLAFRIPSWANGACVAVNDCATNGTIPGRFETIHRVWKAGDRIELTFPMEVETTGGWSASGNALSVRRGPLVYAFAPQFRRHRLDVYSVKGFPTYELIPTEAWSWALVCERDGTVAATLVDDGKPLAEQPFDPLTPPVSLRVKASRTTLAGWGAMRADFPGNACEPPSSPLAETQVSPVIDTISLVPMGCTQVRIAEFPWKK